MTLAAGDDKLVEFKVTPMIRIYLKFQFKDPDENFADKVRVFPKGVAVQIFLLGTEKIECVVGEDGIMLDAPDGKNYIEVKRSKKWFEIKFEQPRIPFVIVEAYDADAAEKPLLIQEDAPLTAGNDLHKKVYEKKRIFMLPKTKWTMKNSDWDVNQAPTYTAVESKFEKLDLLDTVVGEDGSPALLTLDPHWQYIRFEYFDRYYGISDHDKKPISSLPVFLEGYAEDVSAETDPALGKLTTLSCWSVTKDKDTHKLVQVLPWIIRADDANKENANPNQKSMLRFKTDEDHRFLKSTAKDTREWKKLADTDADYKPVADRLRYYDLPEEWRSMQYFCRFSPKESEQEFYEQMARKNTAQGQPLIFSLDDMVLTDKDLKPIEWRFEDTEVEANPNDRVAIFRNTFDGDAWSAAEPTVPAAPPGPPAPPAGSPPAAAPKPAKGARTPADPPAARRGDLAKKPQGPSEQVWHSPEGLYRHDRANNKPYFSRIAVKSNYVADYSGWVRLVAAKGNLFDVFHKRTKFDSAKSKLSTGARAAVAWVDATSSGVGAGAGSAKPTCAIDKAPAHPYFVVQPFHGSEFVTKGLPRPGSQFYNEWTSQIAVDDGTFKNGRSDLALIRCCEYEGAVEKSVLLRFHRFTFDVSDASCDFSGSGGDKSKWRADFLADCGTRWSGGDTVNADRAWLLPKAGATTFKVRVMTFLQAYEIGTDSLKSDWCHFKITTVPENKGSAMTAATGTGKLRGKAGGDTPDRGFAGAHETGHTHGQPDEYPSNDSGYAQQGWGSNHIPGAPFNLDGNAMMVFNREVRPRYFWSLTEWLKNNISDMGTDFKVVHGPEDNYFLPHYPNGATHPGRAFNFWPMRAYTRYHTPADVIYDSYLYKCGKEIFATQVLPQASDGAPVDGILLLLMNVSLEFKGYLADVGNQARRESVAAKLVSKFSDSLNKKVFAAFDLDAPPAPDGKFSKCYLHFVMRLKETLDTKAHVQITVDPAAAADTTVAVSDLYRYTIAFAPPPPPPPPPPGPPPPPSPPPAPTPPASNGAWNTAIDAAVDKAVAEAYKRMGLTVANRSVADSYAPIVKSIGPGLTPTMTLIP
ncbi:MAG TPA: hypothetical protein VGG62_02610 [Terracidiphilus sp.]